MHMHHHSHENHNETEESARMLKPNEAPPAHSPEHKGVHGHPVQLHQHEGGHAGHDKHAGHNIAMFRRKLWLSGVLTIPTLV
jgi:Cu2+-exporting ATPase